MSNDFTQLDLLDKMMYLSPPVVPPSGWSLPYPTAGSSSTLSGDSGTVDADESADDSESTSPSVLRVVNLFGDTGNFFKKILKMTRFTMASTFKTIDLSEDFMNVDDILGELEYLLQFWRKECCEPNGLAGEFYASRPPFEFMSDAAIRKLCQCTVTTNAHVGHFVMKELTKG